MTFGLRKARAFLVRSRSASRFETDALPHLCSDDGTLDSEVREQIRELCERHTGRLDAALKEKLAVSSGKLQVRLASMISKPSE